MRTHRGHKLWSRLFALGTLVICLVLVNRGGEHVSSGSAPTQFEDPKVTVEIQSDSPLTIASLSPASRMAPDSEFVEFSYYVINNSSTPIRAYAIKQDLFHGGVRVGGSVSLYNLALSNSMLSPNQSKYIAEATSVTADKTVVTLSIDFVEFTDGTKWGSDSRRSSERAAGQRFAAQLVTQELLSILNSRQVKGVIAALEGEGGNAEPPPDRSEEWRAGFRSGRLSILSRLKRTKEKNNQKELEQELRRLGETFKSNN